MQRSIDTEVSGIRQAEAGLAEPERSTKMREVLGMVDAAEFVAVVARNKEIPIDTTAINGIQERVMGYFVPEVRGRYRDFDLRIHRSGLRPPHFSQVAGYMFQFGKNLEERQRLLPTEDVDVESVVDLAAWAHCELVRIHPYRDGNGRTARLLAELLLMRYGLYALNDFGNRDEYINVLRDSDETGDHTPFMRFVARHEQVAHQELIESVLSKVGESAGGSQVVRDMITRKDELGRLASSHI